MAKIKSFPNNQDEYIGAEDVMRWLHGRTSGVFGAKGNASVAPVLDSMSVSVSDGSGWLSNDVGDGIAWWVDNEKNTGEKLVLPINIAPGILNRIDRVVVSWETTNYVAPPEVMILEGTPSSNPTPPPLTNSNIVRQISLARIAVPAGATAITSDMITDERLDTSVCGVVTEHVEVDTSVMQSALDDYLAYQKAKWETFFAGVENDTVFPVLSVDDKGKAVVVNEAGDGYALGKTPTNVPVTSTPEDDMETWIDPAPLKDFYGIVNSLPHKGYYDKDGYFTSNEKCSNFVYVDTGSSAKYRIKTYSDERMFNHFDGTRASNSNADIANNPESGIWVYEVDLKNSETKQFTVPFLENGYLNAPEVVEISEVSALKYKDPETGEEKSVGCDGYSKRDANQKFAPAYTYGTNDITAGETPLETGKLYFVYE